jgi:hypothetical protein
MTEKEFHSSENLYIYLLTQTKYNTESRKSKWYFLYQEMRRNAHACSSTVAALSGPLCLAYGVSCALYSVCHATDALRCLQFWPYTDLSFMCGLKEGKMRNAVEFQ